MLSHIEDAAYWRTRVASREIDKERERERERESNTCLAHGRCGVAPLSGGEAGDVPDAIEPVARVTAEGGGVVNPHFRPGVVPVEVRAQLEAARALCGGGSYSYNTHSQ